MSLSLFLFIIAAARAAIVPQPNNTYAVGQVYTELVDSSRSYQGQPWRIMTSVYYPNGLSEDCHPTLVPYFPRLTADVNAAYIDAQFDAIVPNITIPNSTFESLQLQVCNTSSYRNTPDCPTSWPFTILASGAGSSRQLYSALASSLSSIGYIVMTIDDPAQAPVIEYTDGSVLFPGPGAGFDTDEQTAMNLANRTLDIQLAKSAALNGSIGLPAHVEVDCNRLAIWGHSLGGASSAIVISEDSPPFFKAGINLDGTLFESVVETGIERPFAIWTRSNGNLTVDPTWTSFFNASAANFGEGSGLNAQGNKELFFLQDVQHAGFTDGLLLADVAGLSTTPGIDLALGTLDGRRVLDILATYADASFKYGFGEGVSELLQGNSTSYPEVELLSPGLGRD